MDPGTTASIDPKGKARTFDKQTLWPCDGGKILVSLNARRGRPKGESVCFFKERTPKRQRKRQNQKRPLGFDNEVGKVNAKDSQCVGGKKSTALRKAIDRNAGMVVTFYSFKNALLFSQTSFPLISMVWMVSV